MSVRVVGSSLNVTGFLHLNGHEILQVQLYSGSNKENRRLAFKKRCPLYHSILQGSYKFAG